MKRKLLAGMGASACVLGIALLAPAASASAADPGSYKAPHNPITTNNETAHRATWF
jgi:hypothetical protein